MSDSISLSPFHSFRRGNDNTSSLRLEAFDLTSTFAEVFELAKVPIDPKPAPTKRDSAAASSEAIDSSAKQDESTEPAENAEVNAESQPAADESDSSPEIAVAQQVIPEQDVAETEASGDADTEANGKVTATQERNSSDVKLEETDTSVATRENVSEIAAELPVDTKSGEVSVDDAAQRTRQLKEKPDGDQSQKAIQPLATDDTRKTPVANKKADEAVDQSAVGTEEEESLLPAPDVAHDTDDEPRSRRRRGHEKREFQVSNDLPATAKSVPASQEPATIPEQTPIATTDTLPADTATIDPLAAESKPTTPSAPVSSTAATSANAPVAASSVKQAGSQSQAAQSGAIDVAPTVGATKTSGDAKTSATANAQRSEASKLDLADRARLLQRVTKAFQQLGADGGSVKIRLHPPRLGSVGIDVSVSGKKLSARIVTETDAATHVLKEHLPELRTRLAEQGFQLEQIDVNTESGTGSQHGGHGQETPSFRDVAGQPKRQGTQSASTEESVPDTRPATSASSSELDLVA
ncbi:MAG: flagellar hook-length control protein FliK [Pirellulaceae bacterium]